MAERIDRITTVSTDTLLEQAVNTCLHEGLAFAAWKLPGAETVYFAASAEPALLHDVNLEESSPGFLFSPFDPGQKKVFLPADELFTIDGGVAATHRGSMLARLQQATGKPLRGYSRPFLQAAYVTPIQYADLVRRCQDAVNRGDFEKVVPSRTREITLPDGFSVSRTFVELGRKYPTAMVSLFSSAITGTWMGATPELLVTVDAQQHFRTVAVAGTQPFVPGKDLKSVTWTQKEIEEQALVERYIISCFKRIRLREFDEHGPRTVIAGNVVHLKTEFEVDMVATRYPQLGSVMLQLLHPTSAVCGMPMETSLAFLKMHEGYPREYYSGYLGPLKINQESHLFVNLRCMQLGDTSARLYAGGGVLGDSDPQREWEETELKMNTLLSVIRE